MAKRRRKIRVIYTSGATMDFECDLFRVKRMPGGSVEYTWENASPNPLKFGANEVAAVWVLNPETKRGDGAVV